MPDWTLQLREAGSGLHPLWALLLPLGGATLLLRQRHWLLGGLLLCASLGALRPYLLLPTTLPALQQAASGTLWVRGTLREATEAAGRFHLHLQHVELASPTHVWTFPEAEVSFPSRGRQGNFFRGRELQLDGHAGVMGLRALRLQVEWQQAYYRTASQPLVGWARQRATWRLQLEQRIRYYLHGPALAVFLPLTLGLRAHAPRVRQLFQETGMAHLLAISGLHMGLLYGLLLLSLRGLGRGSSWLLQQRWFRPGTQGLALLGLWGYVLLLQNPTPAFRAVLMLTLWSLPQALGWRPPAFHTLLLTASLLLLADPTQVDDLSFQLSFLAVFGILWGLPGHWTPRRPGRRWGAWLWNSTWVTGCVLLFIGPVLLQAFGAVALESLWLNLILIPLLAAVVLPVCLLALLVGAASLGQPPEGWLEQQAFAGADFVLRQWVALLEHLHVSAGAVQLTVPETFGGTEALVYYALLLGVGWGLWWRRPPAD